MLLTGYMKFIQKKKDNYRTHVSTKLPPKRAALKKMKGIVPTEKLVKGMEKRTKYDLKDLVN